MYYLSGKIGFYVKEARNAHNAARTQPDEEAKLDWFGVAASWRLLAERSLVERTGGELLSSLSEGS